MIVSNGETQRRDHRGIPNANSSLTYAKLHRTRRRRQIVQGCRRRHHGQSAGDFSWAARRGSQSANPFSLERRAKPPCNAGGSQWCDPTPIIGVATAQGGEYTGTEPDWTSTSMAPSEHQPKPVTCQANLKSPTHQCNRDHTTLERGQIVITGGAVADRRSAPG